MTFICLKNSFFFIFAFLLIISFVKADVYIISGSIENNALTLEPFFYLGENSEDIESNSDYTAYFYNGDELLKSFRFYMEHRDYGDSFLFSVDIPAETNIVEFKDSQKVLKRIRLSANKPIIHETGMIKTDGIYLISWTASDADNADNDALSYSLYASKDNEIWSPVVFEIKENSFIFNPEDYAEGNYFFKISASDGFNSNEALINGFAEVGNKLPFVSIASPMNNSIFPSSADIVLAGRAYDFEEGILTDNSLFKWSSGSEILGFGKVLSVSSLSEGKHIITLEAMDSQGASGFESILIEVSDAKSSDVSIKNLFIYPSNLIKGVKSIIKIELANVFADSLANLTIYERGLNSEKIIDRIEMPIKANEITPATFLWTPEESGQKEIYAEVSANNDMDNSNNIFRTTAKILSGVLGDINFDGRVNILDLIFARNRLNGNVILEDNWQADVNTDGKINVLDLVYIRNRL